MNYFPVSLAGGKAFCNRKTELKKIHYNLENKISTLLASPRRYGKTSLVLQALEKIEWPYAHVDLYKALDEKDIAQFILNGLGQLLGKIEGTPQKLMKVAAEFFSGFQLKFSLDAVGLSVEFNKKEKRPVDLILAALEKMDAHLVKKNKRAILFLDEFQILAEVTNNHSIEATLREAVQKTKAIYYIFSGSNRHLLELMFNDKKRPFYNSCDQINLKRITKEHYIPYINVAAQERWNHALPEPVMHTILEVTECHPYYINKLCSLMWQQKQLPTTDDVEKTWWQYVDENKSRVEQEVNLLKLNQKKTLLNLILHSDVKEPFGKECALAWGMSGSSIHRAMEMLLQKDYVFIDEEGYYRVLDPLIKTVLSD